MCNGFVRDAEFYDNAVYSSPPYLDTSGFGLLLTVSPTDTVNENVYNDTPTTVYFCDSNDDASCNLGQGFTSATFSLSSTPPSTTPEPGTLVMFGSGLLGLAGLIRRKYVSK